MINNPKETPRAKVYRLLEEKFQYKQSALEWFNANNYYLGGISPNVAIANSREQEVLALLEKL